MPTPTPSVGNRAKEPKAAVKYNGNEGSAGAIGHMDCTLYIIRPAILGLATSTNIHISAAITGPVTTFSDTVALPAPRHRQGPAAPMMPPGYGSNSAASCLCNQVAQASAYLCL